MLAQSIKNFPHRYIAVLSIIVVLSMTVLDATVVNVALPILAVDFHVTEAQSVWIVTIYQLVITMLLLPLSSLGDIHSYKRNFIAGIVVFTSGSALCAFAPSFAFMIISRAIQGVGAAFIMGVNVALLRLIYPEELLGRGLSINAMVIAIASAAGPTIAGAILSIAKWYWLFLINVPLGAVALLLACKSLPQNPKHEHKERFDKVSAIANAVVFGLLFYSITNFAEKGNLLTDSILLGISLLAGYFYILHLRGKENPMLPIDLLKVKVYSLSLLTSVSSFIGQNIAMIALPFLFLNGFGFSELNTGLLMTPWPLATMIVSPFAARLAERHNEGTIAACGMLIFALGMLLLLLVPSEGVPELSIAWRMGVCGVGFGLFQTPNNIVMINSTPIERSGAAGGMQSTARLSGQTLGAAIVTLIFAFSTLPANAVQQSDGVPGVSVSLIVAIGFALIAGTFSISRRKSLKS